MTNQRYITLSQLSRITEYEKELKTRLSVVSFSNYDHVNFPDFLKTIQIFEEFYNVGRKICPEKALHRWDLCSVDTHMLILFSLTSALSIGSRFVKKMDNEKIEDLYFLHTEINSKFFLDMLNDISSTLIQIMEHKMRVKKTSCEKMASDDIVMFGKSLLNSEIKLSSLYIIPRYAKSMFLNLIINLIRNLFLVKRILIPAMPYSSKTQVLDGLLDVWLSIEASSLENRGIQDSGVSSSIIIVLICELIKGILNVECYYWLKIIVIVFYRLETQGEPSLEYLQNENIVNLLKLMSREKFIRRQVTENLKKSFEDRQKREANATAYYGFLWKNFPHVCKNFPDVLSSLDEHVDLIKYRKHIMPGCEAQETHADGNYKSYETYFGEKKFKETVPAFHQTILEYKYSFQRFYYSSEDSRRETNALSLLLSLEVLQKHFMLRHICERKILIIINIVASQLVKLSISSRIFMRNVDLILSIDLEVSDLQGCFSEKIKAKKKLSFLLSDTLQYCISNNGSKFIHFYRNKQEFCDFRTYFYDPISDSYHEPYPEHDFGDLAKQLRVFQTEFHRFYLKDKFTEDITQPTSYLSKTFEASHNSFAYCNWTDLLLREFCSLPMSGYKDVLTEITINYYEELTYSKEKILNLEMLLDKKDETEFAFLLAEILLSLRNDLITDFFLFIELDIIISINDCILLITTYFILNGVKDLSLVFSFLFESELIENIEFESFLISTSTRILFSSIWAQGEIMSDFYPSLPIPDYTSLGKLSLGIDAFRKLYSSFDRQDISSTSLKEFVWSRYFHILSQFQKNRFYSAFWSSLAVLVLLLRPIESHIAQHIISYFVESVISEEAITSPAILIANNILNYVENSEIFCYSLIKAAACSKYEPRILEICLKILKINHKKSESLPVCIKNAKYSHDSISKAPSTFEINSLLKEYSFNELNQETGESLPIESFLNSLSNSPDITIDTKLYVGCRICILNQKNFDMDKLISELRFWLKQAVTENQVFDSLIKIASWITENPNYFANEIPLLLHNDIYGLLISLGKNKSNLNNKLSRSLYAICLGGLGVRDPNFWRKTTSKEINKEAQKEENKSISSGNLFCWIERLVSLVILDFHLPRSSDNDKHGLVIQELLRTLKSGSDPTVFVQWLASFPDGDIIESFLETKFHLQDFKPGNYDSFNNEALLLSRLIALLEESLVKDILVCFEKVYCEEVDIVFFLLPYVIEVHLLSEDINATEMIEYSRDGHDFISKKNSGIALAYLNYIKVGLNFSKDEMLFDHSQIENLLRNWTINSNVTKTAFVFVDTCILLRQVVSNALAESKMESHGSHHEERQLIYKITRIQDLIEFLPYKLYAYMAVSSKDFRKCLYYIEKSVFSTKKAPKSSESEFCWTRPLLSQADLDLLRAVFQEMSDFPSFNACWKSPLSSIDLQQQILDLESVGKISEAELLHSINVGENSSHIQSIGYINCLKKSSKLEKCKDQIFKEMRSCESIRKSLYPNALRSCYLLEDWKSCDKLLEMRSLSTEKSIFEEIWTEMLLSLNKKKRPAFSNGNTKIIDIIVDNLRGRNTVENIYPRLVELNLLHEARGILNLHGKGYITKYVWKRLEQLSGSDKFFYINSSTISDYLLSHNALLESIHDDAGSLHMSIFSSRLRRQLLKIGRTEKTPQRFITHKLHPEKLSKLNSGGFLNNHEISEGLFEWAKLRKHELNIDDAVNTLKIIFKQKRICKNRLLNAKLLNLQFKAKSCDILTRKVVREFVEILNDDASTRTKANVHFADYLHNIWRIHEQQDIFSVLGSGNTISTPIDFTKLAENIILNYLKSLRNPGNDLLRILSVIIQFSWEFSSTHFLRQYEILDDIDEKNPSENPLAQIAFSISKTLFLNYTLVASKTWFSIVHQLVSKVREKIHGTWIKPILAMILSDFPSHASWEILPLCLSTLRDTRQIGNEVKRMAFDLRPGSKVCSQSWHTLAFQVIRLSTYEPEFRVKKLDQICPCLINIGHLDIMLPIQNQMGLVLSSWQYKYKVEFYSDKLIRKKAYEETKLVKMLGFQNSITVLPSKEMPKKVDINCSDGKVYTFLCKTEKSGDLRKDASIMKIIGLLNQIMLSSPESKGTGVHINAYSVNFLSEEAGLIEWVPNTSTIKKIVEKVWHSKGISKKPNYVKKALGIMTKAENKQECFQKVILPSFPTALHIWFYNENLGDLETWLSYRRIFTQSQAIWCMVGFLLGIGDRHPDNLMIVQNSGELMHVDFDCIFWKGLRLPIPEKVPFRLTSNCISPMGVLGPDGFFSFSAEITIRVLRGNGFAIIPFVQNYIADPMLDWIKGSHITDKILKVPYEEFSIENHKHEAYCEGKRVVLEIKSRLKGMVSLTTFDHKRTSLGDDCSRIFRSDFLNSLESNVEESGEYLSVEAQVSELIASAMSLGNLSMMYMGWCPFI